MDIKILGSGCANCKTLEKLTINTLAEMDFSANVEKVEDIVKIMSYGVMRTPALVINEKVVLSGRTPSKSELKEIIQQNNK
jgi:small redox-active disulfide protein 2